MESTRASLLIRIRDRQNARAWEEFDSLYRPMLRRFARARGLDANEAEDVVQQCMAAIIGHIGQFDYDPGKGRFKGWLRTLVNNQVRNRLRRRGEQQADTQVFERDQQREGAPEELFDRIWLRDHLRHCLELIRRQVQRSTYLAFKAYVIEERPVEEVCRELNMTRNQVQLIKWRLTRMLAEKMREEIGDIT
jgi:RNA polymerase sigma-70 factor (ECF subfamily)